MSDATEDMGAAGEKRRKRTRAEPPVKNTRALDITQLLRKKILEGELAPGAHLYEEALSTQLGASRTPVRAALAVLAQENLLVYAPNRGYQVPRFSIDEIMQAYDIRGQLEGYAARIAAERGLTAGAERQMRACLEVVDTILEKGKLVQSDQGTWREMNILFHSAIGGDAQNRFLDDMLQTTRNVPLVSNALAQWYDFETVKRYHADHHAIFDAIRNRQSARAEHRMREHIYEAREFIARAITAEPPVVPPTRRK